MLLITLCVFAKVQAATQIGTTNLLYGESNASVVIMLSTQIDSKATNKQLKVRHLILAEVAKQMVGFQALLNGILSESQAFVVYDANATIVNWKNTNPKLLDTFYKTTSIIQTATSQSQVKNKLTESTAVIGSPVESNVHKFVLVGWVDNIKENETRTPISGTAKVALLYSLEISCEYRLINPDNNNVVAAFIATGRGGIARILGLGSPTVEYDASLITSDMFNSLAENLRHSLRLREDEYIKKKINAKKINASMAMPKK